MNRRVNAYVVIALLGGLLAIPAVAVAGSGGSGLTPSGGASTASGSAQPGNVTVTASGGGITLSTSASSMLSNGLRFSGSVAPAGAGEAIEIERLGHQTNWQWEPTVAATVLSNGSFSAVWRTNHIGQFSIRAVIAPGAGSSGEGAASSAQGASASLAVAPPMVTTTIYRPSIATYYGPGMWGRRTACGVRLTRTTIGVANRTLKCGTKVALYYRGRTMVVPVIDRGPYANGADWDLTEATSRALGTPGLAKIGAVSLPQQPVLP